METKALRLISVALLLAVVVMVLFACFASFKAPTLTECCALLEEKGCYFGKYYGSLNNFLYIQYEENYKGSSSPLPTVWASTFSQVSYEKGLKCSDEYLSIDTPGVYDIVDQIWKTKAYYGTRFYFDGKKLCFLDVHKAYAVVEINVIDSQVETVKNRKSNWMKSTFDYTLELVLQDEAYKSGLSKVYTTLKGSKSKGWGIAGNEDSDWFFYMNESFQFDLDYMEMYLEFEYDLPLHPTQLQLRNVESRKLNVWFMCEGGERDVPVVWFDYDIGK